MKPLALALFALVAALGCGSRSTPFVVDQLQGTDDNGAGKTDKPPEPSLGHGSSIRIGLLFALGGSKASMTEENTTKGIKLAIKQVNDHGGIHGMTIETVALYFDGSTQDAALQAKSAVDQGLTAVLGPSWSNMALQSAPILNDAKVPEIVTLATHPDITRDRPYIFRIVNDEAALARGLAGYVCADRDIKAYVSFVDRADSSSIASSDLFAAAMKAHGAAELNRLYFNSDRDDAGLVEDWKQLLADAPDVKIAFLPLKVRDVGRLMRAARAAGFAGQFVGSDGWGNPELRYAGGQASRGAEFVTHWNPDVDDPTSTAFLDEYYREYKGEPTIGAAVGYDAASALLFALGQVKPGPGGAIDRTAVRDALAGLKDFPCTTGKLSFGADRSASRNLLLLRVGVSRFEISKILPAPPPATAAEVRTP